MQQKEMKECLSRLTVFAQRAVAIHVDVNGRQIVIIHKTRRHLQTAEPQEKMEYLSRLTISAHVAVTTHVNVIG
jgi:hypothetical protein